MNRLLLISLPIIVFLSACQTLDYPDSFDSPGSKIPVGSQIELLQPLTFQRGYSRSFIQFGIPITFNQLEERLPYCQFYRYEPPEDLQTVRRIEPDVFTVTRSYQGQDFAKWKSPVLAQVMPLPGFMNDAGPSDMTLSSILKLESKKQPEIVELKCAVFAEPFKRNYVSVNEIRNTLGNVASIIIK
jgi:hypothetical protein